MLALFDFVTERGQNGIVRWAKGENLSARDRAMLNQKLDRLIQMDFELAIGTKLMAGPFRGGIYKLRVFGDVMMRPFLCKGPVRLDREYTLLVGAVERDGVLDPAECVALATSNRSAIMLDAKRRTPHERV